MLLEVNYLLHRSSRCLVGPATGMSRPSWSREAACIMRVAELAEKKNLLSISTWLRDPLRWSGAVGPASLQRCCCCSMLRLASLPGPPAGGARPSWPHISPSISSSSNALVSESAASFDWASEHCILCFDGMLNESRTCSVFVCFSTFMPAMF